MPEENPAESGPPSRRQLSKRQLVALASVGGTLIGLVAIVVPVAVTASILQSSTATVEVTSQDGSDGGQGLEAALPSLEAVQPGLSASALGANVDFAYANGVWDYAVPVSAPWAELWAAQSNDDNCTTESQRAWLDTHGTMIPTPVVTSTITNTAAAGSDLIVSEIRAQGVLTPPIEDTVTVSWYACSGAGDDGIYAHLTLGVDPVALYDDCYANYGECYFAGGTPPTPGDPVVFPVRPGETRTLNLVYDQTVDFRGRFVATVTVDGQESTIDLSPDAVDVIAPVVTLTKPRLRIAATPGDTFCTPDVDGQPIVYTDGGGDCTLESWLAILAAA